MQIGWKQKSPLNVCLRTLRIESVVSKDSPAAMDMAQNVQSIPGMTGAAPSPAPSDVNHTSRETLREDSSATNLDKDVEKGSGDQAATETKPFNSTTAKDEKKEKSDLVEFDGPDDVGNPKNWSKRKRWGITIAMGLMTFVVTFSSSIFSVAIEVVSVEYHVAPVVATLGVSLFLLVSSYERSTPWGPEVPG